MRGEGVFEVDILTTQVMSKTSKEIAKIGKRMMEDEKWGRFCDIDYRPQKGIVARCLYYEEKGRKGAGVIIVGLNPSKAKPLESSYFKDKSHRNYAGAVRFWEKEREDCKSYYGPLRDLADKIGLTGPILWTELVKCQAIKNGKISVDTIRYSISNYLCREVALFPKGTPIIAVGKRAFELLAYVYPDRKIIGVPHPSRGNPRSNHVYRKGKFVSKGLEERIKKQLASCDFDAVRHQ